MSNYVYNIPFCRDYGGERLRTGHFLYWSCFLLEHRDTFSHIEVNFHREKPIDHD